MFSHVHREHLAQVTMTEIRHAELAGKMTHTQEALPDVMFLNVGGKNSDRHIPRISQMC